MKMPTRKEIREELGGDVLEKRFIANYPGWSNGNKFLFYTENENDHSFSEKKDGFVTVCVNGKTRGINICIKIFSIEELPSFHRVVNERMLDIPCVEKVNGTIVSVNYLDEDQEYGFFYDDYLLIGKCCSAYAVDLEAICKKEGLDSLSIKSEKSVEESSTEDACEQFEEKMKRIYEIGYCGDFINLF